MSATANETLVRQIILDNPELCQLLQIVQKLQLPQGALAAGCIRNTVWSVLSQQPVTFASDIDVVYFDKTQPASHDLSVQDKLQQAFPQYQWQVKNEVYMHQYNFADQPPFTSVTDAIGHFVETATGVGAYLDPQNQLQLITPHGLTDLVQFICRPAPYLQQDAAHLAIFKQRIQQKDWQQRYQQLSVVY
ncbi:nucleotidyltransferase family protein [Lactiplantibacillus daowaiensis]|uniref:Nucleotidyltransferase family protein n=1 Tax=Lactiplantibacillus daowaiensis TaxID=2559918 RepID=A0ABW1S153_9LACO|nr:nucleotidyltransferase family protein [Lactiplantibacillus daowaiensis]